MAIKKELEFRPRQEEAWLMVLKHKYSLLYGGSRSGKTFLLLFIILYRAIEKKSRHAILRFHFSDVKKSIIKETLPELSEKSGIKYKLNQQDWYITLPNGSEIWFGGIDEGRGLDRILGKEYSTIWFNEASEISYDAYTTAMTRLAQKSGLENKILVDQNPPKKTHWTYKLFFSNLDPIERVLIPKPQKYAHIQLNPAHNLPNLSDDYVEMLESLPKEKRRRFLYGEFGDAETGALFSEDNFNKFRVLKHPELKEIVIAVDPATTATMKSDETGLVAVGKGFDNRGYLLEDRSGIYQPKEWAEITGKLYKKYNANYIVAERNQGGDMVKHTIHTVMPNAPVKLEHAYQGKMLRAEPVSVLYEDGKISHVGSFPDTEDEMANYTGDTIHVEDGGGTRRIKSPNRLDAIVYGFMALFPVNLTDESEIFNRDKLHYFKEYDLTDSKNILYIKISSINNRNGFLYNFSAISLSLKDKKAFVRDIVFNNTLPPENIENINKKIELYNPNKIYLECNKSFSSFASDLNKKSKKQVWQIKEFTQETNHIISEVAFIREKFVFDKKNESISYKNFMQQLNSYTNLSDTNESYASSVLSSISYVLKKVFKSYIV